MYRFSLAATLFWQTLPAAATSSSDRKYLWIALAIGVLALIAALMFARSVLASDTGTPEMRAISDAIREGAEAFLRRQYRTIGVDRDCVWRSCFSGAIACRRGLRPTR